MEYDLAPILDRHRRDPSHLLQILREIQEQRGWIDLATRSALAESLNISPAAVWGTLHFYSFLNARPAGRFRVLVSDNFTDRMAGSADILEQFKTRFGIEEGKISPDGRVGLDLTSCTGMCDQGPAILVNGRAIPRMTKARADQVADLIECETPLATWPQDLFTVVDNIRRPDLLLSAKWQPGDAIRAAIARGPEAVITEIESSRLRGRGGAGFPTAAKWKAARNAVGDTRYVVCNADEGEPGTFKDRVLLTSYSDAVVEGMTIAALAIGAKCGYLYVRGEYAYLREQLEAMLSRRRRLNLLGPAILGSSDFDFDVEIHWGAGAYVCGEESALLESLEGRPGRPRIRPPFPVTSGLFGKPTVVNNVETLTAVTQIMIEGGERYRALGTAQSSGTKILSVSGDCERPGIYEYAFGTRIAQILEDCGAQNTKAVQMGGASGRCLAEKDFSHRLAFEDVASAGAFMVLDGTRDVFDMALNFSHFFAHESCGFCTPCRVGTSLVRDQMEDIARGRGTHYTVNEIMKLADVMRRTSHCGLGQTACNAILDTVSKFRPSWDRRLTSTDFEPTFDLEAALGTSRKITGRDDAGAHLKTTGGPE